MNLDKLRAVAEKAFASKREGGTGNPPWRYMTDEERRRLRNPAPVAVTPAIVAQLADLQSRTVPTLSPSRWQAIVNRVEAKRQKGKP